MAVSDRGRVRLGNEPGFHADHRLDHDRQPALEGDQDRKARRHVTDLETQSPGAVVSLSSLSSLSSKR